MELHRKNPSIIPFPETYSNDQPVALPIQTSIFRKALLIYPLFPPSFWSFEGVLALSQKKALLPPLGLITIAAILPQTWKYKLVDRNVREVTSEEWDWADLVIISGMIVQKEDFLACVREAKLHQTPVAAGGPYVTALYPEIQAHGADYLVLDEGEITLPLLVKALEKGEPSGIFRASARPDVTLTPIPRFDLLEMGVYDSMSVQFSRGCPFQCEFCDIIVLYGRKPRTKAPQQLLQELDALYDLGWRGVVFIVDDNFIGNKRNVKGLLRELQGWQKERGYPFLLLTEASVDLADDSELMDLMANCGFYWVFLGLETPDESSLKVTKKFQNIRSPMLEAIDKIYAKGIRVTAGLIIGFDGEKPGAGQRIVDFADQAAIPVSMLNLLQALPDTALWNRLRAENRLLDSIGTGNNTALINFIPDRPIEEIVTEYLDALSQLFDPERYLDRVYKQFMRLAPLPHYINPPKNSPRKMRFSFRKTPPPQKSYTPSPWIFLTFVLTVFWRQGLKRSSRRKFWGYLFSIWRTKRYQLVHYLGTCAMAEHFIDYYPKVKAEITVQLTEHLEARRMLSDDYAELKTAKLKTTRLKDA
ncbi:MAG: B12-binding domain-containing radical SAM protein [Cyanobacteria bacterium J06627_28]